MGSTTMTAPAHHIHLQAIEASIKAHGQLQPIILDAAGQVIDGNARLMACTNLGIPPWTRAFPDLTKEHRHHLHIRKGRDPNELADLVAHVAAEVVPIGARRAHGSGSAKEVIARELAQAFAVNISPREVAYALRIARATEATRAALRATAPTSMRAAQQTLLSIEAGSTEPTPAGPDPRTELFKQANELRSAIKRHTGPLAQADVALLQTLRDEIDTALGGQEAA